MAITYRLLGRNGRLGNQLWQIASTIGIATSRGTTPAFPYWRYRDYFSVPETYFPDLTTVSGEDLGGDWLQELRYLTGVEDHIRQIFSPSRPVWDRIAQRHRHLLELTTKTAIHVRRGDYLALPDNYVPLGDLYYDAALAATNPPYLVFSDDIGWCRSRFKGQDFFFVEHNRDYEDLFLMSTCDAVITANSTFSWWGAWLSGGRTIHPRRWFLPGHTENPWFGTVKAENMFSPSSEILDS